MLFMTQSLLSLTRQRADSSSSTLVSAPAATAATMAMVRLAPSMVTTGLRYSSTIRFTASKWLTDSSSAAFPQFSGSARAGCATHKLLPLPATFPFSHSIEICKQVS